MSDLLDRHRALIRANIEPLLAPGEPVALLDYPNHENVGDSAIWMGERAFLRDLGHPVAYTCDLLSYSRRQLISRLPTGPILLHGGGNLGDLWTAHQDFRELVIRDFGDRRIIQLPQTVSFQQPAGAARFAALVQNHPDLTLLVRDDASLAFAQQHLGPATLTPDMATWLSLGRTRQPTEPIVWLCRTDHETTGDHGPGPLAPTPVDWVGKRSANPRHVLLRESTRAADAFLTRRAKISAAHAGFRERTYDRLAQARVDHGLAMLSQGRVVVTDRLHGHILSLLAGISHVLLDSKFGKVGNYYSTWTADSDFVRWSTSLPAAFAVAADLAATTAA